MENIRPTTNPLSNINLPSRGIVHSTHECDVNIPGLPLTLTGHIVSRLTMASLMGIRVLCKAGCKIIFTNDKSEVKYQGVISLTGTKDPTTNLWMLPITPAAINNNGMFSAAQKLQAGPILACTPAHPTRDDWATFAHSVQTHAHQSMGNLKLSTLLKAIRKRFVRGCPNLNEKLVTKYLNSSPAMAKGHMKQPKKGIHSTTPCQTKLAPLPAERMSPPIAQPAPPLIPHLQDIQHYPGPAYTATHGPNLIVDDESIANVFCFGAFANKVAGVI